MKLNITVVGVGLIGGSIALKLRRKGIAGKIFGVDFSENHLQQALERNIIDETADLEFAVKNSDLIIVSVPVTATAEILPEILDLTENQTVMDVGSTKEMIIKSVENHPKRNRFVAFHPMWGTENSGPNSAMEDAFSGKAAVICDRENSASDALTLAEKIAENLEMNVLYMSAKDHDIHTAYISHISHISSYALANTVLEKEREEETIFQLASSGFSSTVRLAKSHPEMWVPIFQQNKENVLDVLNEHITQLRKIKSALEKENYELLEDLIRNANRIRGILK